MSRIIKISLLITTSAFLLFAGCKKNKPPEIPDKPIGPTLIIKNDTAQYSTKTHDPNQTDEIRYIFDWGIGKKDTTDYYPNDSTVEAIHLWTETGQYAVKVMAQDNKNALSKDWSDTLLVKVVLNHGPDKPLTPSTTGPPYGLPNTIYTFKTVAIDPDNDSVAVKFNWGNGRITSWSGFHVSGDTIRDTITYSDTGKFLIKVIAKDIYGDSSEWSNSFRFAVRTIMNRAPEKPLTPIGPPYGLINTQYTFKTVVSDLDNDSVAVMFDWGNGRISNWTKFYASEDTLEDTITYPDTGTFSIKVMAKDIFEDTSEWSDTCQFRVLEEGDVKAVFHAVYIHEIYADTLGFQSSPAIVNIAGIDKIFIGSEASYAYIVNTQNMNYEQRIQHYKENPEDMYEWGNTPAVDAANQRWYIANDQGEFYALSFNGSRLWRYPGFSVNFTGWNFTDAAFISNYVYVATEDTLYALNASAGTKVWIYRPEGVHIMISPIIDANGNVLIGDDSGYVRKLNGSTGALIWEKDIGGWIQTSGAIGSDGTIYFGVNGAVNKKLCALEPDSGSLLWSYPLDEYIVTSLAIDAQDFIYFACDHGQIHAVKNGISKSGFPITLRVDTLNATLSTPTFAADGYFYVMTEEQHVFCIGTDGIIRWNTRLPSVHISKFIKLSNKREDDLIPSPVIGSDGDIYVAGGADYRGLYQLQGRSTGTPMLNSPWPTFRHDRQRTGKAGFPTR